MPKTLHYGDTAQIPEADADTLRDTAFGWHDPSSDQFVDDLREQPMHDGDSAITNDDGDPLVELTLTVHKSGIPDDVNWQTKADDMATAINTGLPDSWPTVVAGDIDVR